MSTKIHPPHEYADQEVDSLARSLDEMAGEMMDLVDKVMRTRTAPGSAQRQRSMMKTNLEAAIQCGVNALAHTRADQAQGG